MAYSELAPQIDNYKILGYSVLFSGICEECKTLNN